MTIFFEVADLSSDKHRLLLTSYVMWWEQREEAFENFERFTERQRTSIRHDMFDYAYGFGDVFFESQRIRLGRAPMVHFIEELLSEVGS